MFVKPRIDKRRAILYSGCMRKGFSLVELVVTLTILAVFGLVVYVWWNDRTTNEVLQPGTPAFAQALTKDLLNGPQRDGEVPTAPKLEFAEYVLADSTTLPELLKEVKVYPLQTKLSVEQAQRSPQRIGLEFNAGLSNPEAFAFTNFSQPENLGYWITHPTTGAFSFQSFGTHTPTSAPSDDPSDIAASFLRENGLWDETLIVTTTVKDEENSPFTNVIIHRDWAKAGLPILNSVGVLNMPTDQRLSTLEPSAADDFNALKVTVTDDGRVWAINSNLRPLGSQPLTLNPQQLKPPTEALAEIRAGQGIFQLSAPIGEGSTDFNQVYPGGTAKADTAMITDFELVYLEKHAQEGLAQKYLQPVYLARGTARLDSGYTVKWSQVVGAVQDSSLTSLTSLASLVSKIRPARAQTTYEPYSTGLEVPGLGTFTICGEAHTYCFKANTLQGEASTVGKIRDIFFDKLAQQYVINISKTLVSNASLLSMAETATTVAAMEEVFASANGVSSITRPNNCNVIYACVADTAPFRKPDKPRLGCWNVVDDRVNPMVDTVANTLIEATRLGQVTPVLSPSPTPTLSEPTTAPDPGKVIFEPLANQQLTLSQWSAQANIFPDRTLRCLTYAYTQFGPSDDQTVGTKTVRISGESPTIFVYGANDDAIEISLPQDKLTYHEPLHNGRLYYEFDPAKVDLEAERVIGMIRENDVAEFVEELAEAWQLAPPEEVALKTDLERAVATITTQHLTPNTHFHISLASQASLDRELPLKVDPTPDRTYRLHLLVSPASQERLEGREGQERVDLSPIGRSGFTILETGASPLF